MCNDAINRSCTEQHSFASLLHRFPVSKLIRPHIQFLFQEYEVLLCHNMFVNYYKYLPMEIIIDLKYYE